MQNNTADYYANLIDDVVVGGLGDLNVAATDVSEIVASIVARAEAVLTDDEITQMHEEVDLLAQLRGGVWGATRRPARVTI